MADRPCIYVLAGTNGAGKSSIGGAMIRSAGGDYFNPDEATRRILAANPDATPAEANSAAWQEGRRLLERAILERRTFALETTLGGNTVPRLLQQAAAAGLAVRIWYVGLSSPELHLSRVRARVAAGGHDIPADKIRERYDRSRLNLIGLLPVLDELRVYDNSAFADPASGSAPRPRLILHLKAGRVAKICSLARVPRWARPLAAAALKLSP